MLGTRRHGTSSRRRFLLGLGTVGIASVAGCSRLEYPGDSEDEDDPSPPGTEFGFALDPDAGTYTVTYEGEDAFDEDNADLLAVDHVTDARTATRTIWFGGDRSDPIDPGESTTSEYDADRVTALEVVWAPPGTAGSGRAPDVLAEYSTP